MTVAKVEVFDTETEHLAAAEAGAIQQARRQACLSLCGMQHACDFRAREHHGEPVGAFGPDKRPDFAEIDVQHSLVEEEERAERLVLRGRGDVALLGQIRSGRTGPLQRPFPGGGGSRGVGRSASSTGSTRARYGGSTRARDTRFARGPGVWVCCHGAHVTAPSEGRYVFCGDVSYVYRRASPT